MNSDITFRRGTIADIPAFLSYFKISIPLLFPEYSPNSNAYEVEVDYNPQWITNVLTKGSKIVYLAYYQNNIVGYLFTAKSIAGVSFADWLAVDKNAQKQGIATKLLSLWQDAALVEGAHALHLWTTKNNICFYENRGFTNGGLFPKAWHGHDSYLIYKSLREPEEKNFLKEYLKQKNNL